MGRWVNHGLFNSPILSNISFGQGGKANGALRSLEVPQLILCDLDHTATSASGTHPGGRETPQRALTNQ
jgi:hypothetical protein